MCDTCDQARAAPLHPMFCPACLHCGARLIQRLGHLPRSRDEIKARRQAVLRDWMAFGHAEEDLRALAKGPLPLAPPAARRGKRTA